MGRRLIELMVRQRVCHCVDGSMDGVGLCLWLDGWMVWDCVDG